MVIRHQYRCRDGTLDSDLVRHSMHAAFRRDFVALLTLPPLNSVASIVRDDETLP